MPVESSTAYRHGFIAANAAAVISRYQSERKLDQTDIPMVAQAEDLLTDALQCRSLFTAKPRQMEADNDSIQAFNSALAAVSACRDILEADDLSTLMSLFKRIREVVRGLAGSGYAAKLADRDLEDARRYFECLAGHMVAEVSKPRPPGPVFKQP